MKNYGNFRFNTIIEKNKKVLWTEGLEIEKQ